MRFVYALREFECANNHRFERYRHDRALEEMQCGYLCGLHKGMPVDEFHVIRCPQCNEPAIKEIPQRQARKSGLFVLPDIESYQSVITEEWITSRSKHREHLRQHNCIEVGSEAMSERHREYRRQLQEQRQEKQRGH